MTRSVSPASPDYEHEPLVQRAGDGRDRIQAYVKALEALAGIRARAD